MIPKEKAEELLRRFMPYVYGIGNIGDGIHKHNAKQCAIILCDEMISNINEVGFYLEYPFSGEIDYWQSVRTEIEKL